MKKNYLLFCLILLSIGCQRDEIIVTEAAQGIDDKTYELVNFNDLPENILKDFDESNYPNLSDGKSENLFGQINRDKKVKKLNLKGKLTYTFSLKTNEFNKSQNTPDGYYFDNLVIKENSKSDNELMVIRYEPTNNWLDNGHNLDSYSGKITFYSINGEKLNSINLKNNENIGDKNIYNKQVCPAYLVSVTYSCSGMEGSMGGDCHWIYTYEIKCSSGGTPGPNGPGGGLGNEEPSGPDFIPSEPTEDFDYGGGGTPYTPPQDPEPLKPCPGNPIKSPEIAKSGGWNIQGGRFGNTRSGGNQFHDGTDIKAAVNSNLYSMHGGIIVDIRDSFSPGEYRSRSYGNYVTIQTTFPNGEVVQLTYNHLNSVNVTRGSTINANELIGKSGNTGNAQQNAGSNIPVIPHVHIKARLKNGSSWVRANPEKYLASKFNSDGTINQNINPCN